MLTAVSALPLQKEKTDKRKQGMASMPLSKYFRNKNEAAPAPQTAGPDKSQAPQKPPRPKRKMTLGQRIAQKD